MLRHFQEGFRSDPASAYRQWFRIQEELSDRGDDAAVRMLADELWQMLPKLAFESDQARARFFHNVAVFFGSPGPAAHLSRAREAFRVTLEYFAAHEESGWRARALHNFATALSNLGQTPEDLAESVALFEKTLEWRTEDRAIARGVTLHNLGLALRRLAELDPTRAREHLEASAEALHEAVAIREAHGLAEGHALSQFHLGVTLENLADQGDSSYRIAAREAFDRAVGEFEALGKEISASIARKHIPPGTD